MEIQLKDGKRILGVIKQASSKSLTLTDALFQDGGVSPVFKIKADKLCDLKVLKLPCAPQGQRDNNNEQLSPAPTSSRDRRRDMPSSTSPSTAEPWDTEISSDFDFQGNLQRFNKKDVFKDFQNIEIPSDPLKVPHNEMVTESINITHLLRNDSVAASLAAHRKTFTCNKGRTKVPTATPIQLLEMEKLSAEKFGFTLPLSLEHSGVHLSRLLRTMLKSHGSSTVVGDSSSNNQDAGESEALQRSALPLPLVVAFISAGRSGSRCVSALRCLLAIQDVECIVVDPFGKERNGLDADHRETTHQLSMLHRFRNVSLPESLTALKRTVNGKTPAIIIDALQGFDDTLADLDVEPEQGGLQTTISDYIDWINHYQQTGPEIVSLDCPAHIDPSSGDVLASQFVRPSCILATGWPLQSLPKLTALLPDWKKTYVYHTGIPHDTYLLRPNLRKFHHVDVFGNAGVQELRHADRAT